MCVVGAGTFAFWDHFKHCKTLIKSLCLITNMTNSILASVFLLSEATWIASGITGPIMGPVSSSDSPFLATTFFSTQTSSSLPELSLLLVDSLDDDSLLSESECLRDFFDFFFFDLCFLCFFFFFLDFELKPEKYYKNIWIKKWLLNTSATERNLLISKTISFLHTFFRIKFLS